MQAMIHPRISWRLRSNPIPDAYDRGYRRALEDIAGERAGSPGYLTRLSVMRARLFAPDAPPQAAEGSRP
jgi:hypothetical protein